MGRNIGKNISKNFSSKYSQKLVDYGKQSTTDTFKTASKRVIQKKEEEIKLLIELQKSEKLHHRIIEKKMFNMIEKYINKDICPKNEDRKLLII